MDRYEKLRLSLRYYLQGAADQDSNYVVALDAFEFAMAHHRGVRKDGVTPEFQHQLETTQYVRTLRSGLLYPAQTLAAMLLHDTAEDYDIDFAEIRERFGAQVEHAVRRLTKLHRGVRKTDEQYFTEMLDCPIATVCKGADRGHNQQTMVGVFTLAKQQAYIEETETWILPMLKKARRAHPRQEAAYENLKFLLRSQVELIKAVHKAAT